MDSRTVSRQVSGDVLSSRPLTLQLRWGEALIHLAIGTLLIVVMLDVSSAWLAMLNHERADVLLIGLVLSSVAVVAGGAVYCLNRSWRVAGAAGMPALGASWQIARHGILEYAIRLRTPMFNRRPFKPTCQRESRREARSRPAWVVG
ncbi:hypothetical protein [Chitinivorax sp. B]|uniref:hypothetical protein n=1 Tax=Chitinivorax sp. B TaxID=2502235 RepID=UPI0010FA5942|nr:hypothetical protein [Chitinivorax sp. B]